MSQFTQDHVNWANAQVAAGAYPDLKAAVDALCQHSNIPVNDSVYASFGIQTAPANAPVNTQQTATQSLPTDNAPSSLEVSQEALPAGFDINATLAGRLPSEKSTSRPKNWEVSIEELRSRVTFRDGQPVGQKDDSVVWLRPYLSPNTVAVEEVNGVQPDGAPKNHWVVEARFEEAMKAEIMKLFNAGVYDAQLKATAELQRQKQLEKDNEPTRAPIDQNAADAALGELAAAQAPNQTMAAGVATMDAPTNVPAGMPAGMPAGAAPSNVPNMPAGAPAGAPAGMPSGIPGL